MINSSITNDLSVVKIPDALYKCAVQNSVQEIQELRCITLYYVVGVRLSNKNFDRSVEKT